MSLQKRSEENPRLRRRSPTPALLLLAVTLAVYGSVRGENETAHARNAEREAQLHQMYGGFLDDLFLELGEGGDVKPVAEEQPCGSGLNLEEGVREEVCRTNPVLAPHHRSESEEDTSGHFGLMDQGVPDKKDEIISEVVKWVMNFLRETSWIEHNQYCNNMRRVEASEMKNANTHESCHAYCRADPECTAWHFSETQAVCTVGDPISCNEDFDRPRGFLRGKFPGMYSKLTKLAHVLNLSESPELVGAEDAGMQFSYGMRNVAATRFITWALGWVSRAHKETGHEIEIPSLMVPGAEVDAEKNPALDGVKVPKVELIRTVMSSVMLMAADGNAVSTSQGKLISIEFNRFGRFTSDTYASLVFTPEHSVRVKEALESPLDGSGIRVSVTDTTGMPLALQARTTLFDEETEHREEGAMKKAFLQHLEHAGGARMMGYQLRTAVVTLGDGKDKKPTIQTDSTEQVGNIITFRNAMNAFGIKAVYPYEDFEGDFAEQTWERAAHLFRGLGYETDQEYELGVIYRTAKPPSKLEYTPEEYAKLPGTVWHKDVYAMANVIFYPFCFLEGFDTEMVTREQYEEVDPGSRHLGTLPVSQVTFDDSVTLKSFGDGKESPNTGHVIAFQNDFTRHAAHPPQKITKEQKQAAIDDSIKYNSGEGRLPGDIIRVFLHFSLRRKDHTLTGLGFNAVKNISPSTTSLAAKILAPTIKRLEMSEKSEIDGYSQVGGFAESPESNVPGWYEKNGHEYEQRAKDRNNAARWKEAGETPLPESSEDFHTTPSISESSSASIE